ncbi:hypothetical protein CF645_38010, partial [Burkholderia pseudomallei]
PDFLARYPGIRLHIGAAARFVALVRAGVACVLRAGNLQASSTAARRVAHPDQVTVASPRLLARHGEAAAPARLAAQRAVAAVAALPGLGTPGACSAVLRASSATRLPTNVVANLPPGLRHGEPPLPPPSTRSLNPTALLYLPPKQDLVCHHP